MKIEQVLDRDEPMCKFWPISISDISWTLEDDNQYIVRYTVPKY